MATYWEIGWRVLGDNIIGKHLVLNTIVDVNIRLIFRQIYVLR